MITINKKAPDFSLPDEKGVLHTLSQYVGKWVVVYFYPRDNTPGCTKEACSFRDAKSIYDKEDIIVLGISKDSVASHQKFSTALHLSFPILSDPTHTTIEAYGAWAPKKFMGREFLGTLRKTVLIDPKGIVRKIYDNVDVNTHAEEIIKDIASFV